MINKIFAFLFLGICIETVQIQAINWFIPRIDPILALFLKKYAPPAEVIKHLDKNQEFISPNISKSIISCCLKNDSHPDYLLKSGTDRLLNAIRLKNFIQKENLTAFDVAEKYIYCKDNQCIIIAKFVEESAEGKKITSEITEQLLTVAEKTNFSDWHEENLIRTKNEKLCFIDTEDHTFNSIRDSILDHPSGTVAQSVGHLFLFLPKNKKIHDRLNVLIKDKEASTKIITPIYNNNTLDPENFNLEEIRGKLYNYTNNETEYELNHELMCSLGDQLE